MLCLGKLRLVGLRLVLSVALGRVALGYVLVRFVWSVQFRCVQLRQLMLILF